MPAAAASGLLSAKGVYSRAGGVGRPLTRVFGPLVHSLVHSFIRGPFIGPFIHSFKDLFARTYIGGYLRRLSEVVYDVHMRWFIASYGHALVVRKLETDELIGPPFAGIEACSV